MAVKTPTPASGLARVLPLRRVEGQPEEMSDEALIAACGQGDTAALGALFDRHQAALRRFLGRLNGADESSLDDLVQNTFLELMKSAKSFRGKAAGRTWIYGVAHNVAKRYVRTEIRRKGLLAAFRERPSPKAPEPEALASRAQDMGRFEQALSQLPHLRRSAFLLFYVEGLSGAATARALGLREGTLWRHLHEARAALQSAVAEGTP